MKTIFSILFLMAAFHNPSIVEVRKAYPNAANSESSANEFAAKMSEVSGNDSKVLQAYKGASLAMTSKFKKKIAQKISTLKEGAKMIESSITGDPNNIEIRLIRLSIQENVPGITNYKKNISEDKAFILQHYKEQEDALKAYVKAFILQSKSFSAEEKQAVK